MNLCISPAQGCSTPWKNKMIKALDLGQEQNPEDKWIKDLKGSDKEIRITVRIE